MGKGYADGPATEERLTEDTSTGGSLRAVRRAVYGSTEAEPDAHFIGWLGEVDPEALFSSGAAWGISVVERAA